MAAALLITTSILINSRICCSGRKEATFPCTSFTSSNGDYYCYSSSSDGCARGSSVAHKKKKKKKKRKGEVLSSCLTSWEAWGHLGTLPFAWSQRGVFSVKKERSSRWGGVLVQASFLGVGAPEVLVIAVVALLVFGPKGLAEVARTLGKSLRAFQPTIRELQEVSRDFKQTLEKEIGLDELRSVDSRSPNSAFTVNEQPKPSLKSNVPAEDRAYSAEDYSKFTEEQLKAGTYVPEEQRQAAAASSDGSSPTKLNLETDNNDSTSKQD